MKIVFCDNSLVSLLNFRGDVIQYFLNSGHQVFLIYPKQTCNKLLNPIPVGSIGIGVDMAPVGLNPLKDLRCSYALYKQMRKIKPDIVFNYTVKPNIYGTLASKAAGVKYVVSMVPGLGFIFEGNSFLKKIARILYKIALKKSSYTIVLNEANQDTLLSGDYVDKKKLILFDCGEGVNLLKFPFVPNRFDNVRCLMVARILYDKGYKEFVEAAKIVQENFANVSFELLGALDEDSPMGVSRQQLESDVRAGFIRYLGVSSDVPSIVCREGTLVVLPSYHEGMNRSLMEACAMGRPIITTNIPGCREMVQNGKNGFLVEPKNAHDLAHAIMKFCKLDEKDKQDMCLHSYAIAKNCFNVNKVISYYQHIVSECK